MICFKEMAKLCTEDALEDEDLPRPTKKVLGTVGEQLLEDVEARNVFTNDFSAEEHGLSQASG